MIDIIIWCLISSVQKSVNTVDIEDLTRVVISYEIDETRQRLL